LEFGEKIRKVQNPSDLSSMELTEERMIDGLDKTKEDKWPEKFPLKI
jgi:hypothetical protein